MWIHLYMIHILKENDQIIGNPKLWIQNLIKAWTEEMWIHCYIERNPHFEGNQQIHGKSKKCGLMSIGTNQHS